MELHQLTVHDMPGYNAGKHRPPLIRLQGLWLERAGYHIGDRITVIVEDDGTITIRPRTEDKVL